MKVVVMEAKPSRTAVGNFPCHFQGVASATAYPTRTAHLGDSRLDNKSSLPIDSDDSKIGVVVHFGEDESRAPNIQVIWGADTVVLVGSILCVFANWTQSIVGVLGLVITNVHVGSADVGSWGVACGANAGTRNVAVGFTHIPKGQLTVVAKFPASVRHATNPGRGVSNKISNVASNEAAVLIGSGFTVDFVIPIVIAHARIKGYEITAIASGALPAWDAGCVAWSAIGCGKHVAIQIRLGGKSPDILNTIPAIEVTNGSVGTRAFGAARLSAVIVFTDLAVAAIGIGFAFCDTSSAVFAEGIALIAIAGVALEVGIGWAFTASAGTFSLDARIFCVVDHKALVAKAGVPFAVGIGWATIVAAVSLVVPSSSASSSCTGGAAVSSWRGAAGLSAGSP